MNVDEVIIVAEANGEERRVDSVDEARKVVWNRMKRIFGADLDVAKQLLLALAQKESFRDLDAAECFDLSFLFLDESRDVLEDELASIGLGELVPLIRR